MPPPEVRHREQSAVYWEKTGIDDNGEPTVAAPRQLTVRWESQVREGIDANGDPIALDGMVIVNEEVVVGSTMWLGTLVDWNATGSAGEDSRVMRVETYTEVPDVRNRWIRREVGLKWYRDDHPSPT